MYSTYVVLHYLFVMRLAVETSPPKVNILNELRPSDDAPTSVNGQRAINIANYWVLDESEPSQHPRDICSASVKIVVHVHA